MSDNRQQQLGNLIKDKALSLGFDAVGFARVQPVNEKHTHEYLDWLSRDYHGKMQFMDNYKEQRLDPGVLVPGARTVISLAINYHQKDFQPEGAFYRISQYAAGIDYHQVIKHKLYHLLEYMNEQTGEVPARVFTDSAPVMERYWAQQAGLGAPGKNSCLILPKKGSYFFLSEIITGVELPYDQPYEKDPCGTCTRCMIACPTKAIVSPGKIDSRYCTSYLTIELKDDIPSMLAQQTKGYIFGCDICQNVCPHNTRFATPCTEEGFKPLPAVSSWQKEDWEGMEKNTYRHSFIKTHSPIARARYDKLKATIREVGNGFKI